ncbi:MAG: hypothetical protein U0V56_05525 [Actinomycetota bacterium]
MVGLLLAGLSDAASLVMVNGAVLVEEGRPVHVDTRTTAARARAPIPAVLTGE